LKLILESTKFLN